MISQALASLLNFEGQSSLWSLANRFHLVPEKLIFIQSWKLAIFLLYKDLVLIKYLSFFIISMEHVLCSFLSLFFRSLRNLSIFFVSEQPSSWHQPYPSMSLWNTLVIWYSLSLGETGQDQWSDWVIGSIGLLERGGWSLPMDSHRFHKNHPPHEKVTYRRYFLQRKKS